MFKKIAVLFCMVFVISGFCANKTIISTQKSTKAKSTRAKNPPIPSLQTIENVIKNGVVIDFGDGNIQDLAKKFTTKNDLKIHFFGDSHIAADSIPHQWRIALANTNSIGFAYPLFPKYHQNLLIAQKSQFFEIYNSRIYSYSNYPLGGVIARAKNEKANLRISLNFTPDNQRFLTQITFKSPNLLGAFVVTDSAGKSFRLASKMPNTWEISEPISLRFPITIQALMPNVMLGGYFIYNSNINNFISHSSANGVRSDIYLKWDQNTLKKQLEILQYDLIVLCYGSNDAMIGTFNEANFMQNYKNLIALLRQTNPNATILIMGPPKVVIKHKNASKYTLTPNSDSVRKAIAKLAKNEKTLYFDMYEIMEKTGGKDKWIKVGLSKQDTHLTPYGYRAVADAMYSGLQKLLKDKATQTTNIENTEAYQWQDLDKANPESELLEPKVNNPSNLDSPMLKMPQNDVPEEIWQDLQIRDLDSDSSQNIRNQSQERL